MAGETRGWRGESYGGAGAVWDIWRRQDVPKLRQYLRSHAGEFTHLGEPLVACNIEDVIHSQVQQCPLAWSQLRPPDLAAMVRVSNLAPLPGLPT